MRRWNVTREITETFEIEAATKKEAEELLATEGDPGSVTVDAEIWEEDMEFRKEHKRKRKGRQ